MKYKKRWLRTLLYTVIAAVLALAGVIWMSHVCVESASAGRVYTSIDSVPNVRVGLVFGTSKFTADGRNNLYYANRIAAAVKLYKAGKIQRLLISGDNQHRSYNEPQTMRNSLVELGVAAEHITLDYAGFDTYDSVIRANKVFKQDTIVVISQEFQNRRAVYIAQSNGIVAYGYNAQDVSALGGGLKTRLREYLARVKAVVEVWMNVQPTYLGEPVEIP